MSGSGAFPGDLERTFIPAAEGPVVQVAPPPPPPAPPGGGAPKPSC
jgi:hypothetical protein